MGSRVGFGWKDEIRRRERIEVDRGGGKAGMAGAPVPSFGSGLACLPRRTVSRGARCIFSNSLSPTSLHTLTYFIRILLSYLRTGHIRLACSFRPYTRTSAAASSLWQGFHAHSGAKNSRASACGQGRTPSPTQHQLRKIIHKQSYHPEHNRT